jgi:hypothetical protein
MTIVGIVKDIRTGGPSRPVQAEIYMPYEQHQGPATWLNLVIRTDAMDPLALGTTASRQIRERYPEVPVRLESMDTTLSGATATPRFRTVLLALFAVAYTAARAVQVLVFADVPRGLYPLRMSFDELARRIEAEAGDRPTAIIARTHKGHGVSAVDDQEGKHGKPLPEPDEAIAELGGVRHITVEVTPPVSNPVERLAANGRNKPPRFDVLPRLTAGDSNPLYPKVRTG